MFLLSLGSDIQLLFSPHVTEWLVSELREPQYEGQVIVTTMRRIMQFYFGFNLLRKMVVKQCKVFRPETRMWKRGNNNSIRFTQSENILNLRMKSHTDSHFVSIFIFISYVASRSNWILFHLKMCEKGTQFPLKTSLKDNLFSFRLSLRLYFFLQSFFISIFTCFGLKIICKDVSVRCKWILT